MRKAQATLGSALRRLLELGQRLLQKRKQTPYPVVGLRLTEAILQSQKRLQFIGFGIGQNEEQFIFDLPKIAFDPATGFAFAGFARDSLLDDLLLIERVKGAKQMQKFFAGQARDRRKLFRFGFEKVIIYAKLYPIPDKVY